MHVFNELNLCKKDVMIPIVINLLIPSGMDIPTSNWKNNQASILKKIIETLPLKKIELLTFNREEMANAYRQQSDTIVLEIKVTNSHLNDARTDVSLTDKIITLLSSKMVRINKYAKKLQPGMAVFETRISIDIDAAA